MNKFSITLINKKDGSRIEDEHLVYNDRKFYEDWGTFEAGIHLDMEEWEVWIKGDEPPQEYFDDMVDRLKNSRLLAKEE